MLDTGSVWVIVPVHNEATVLADVLGKLSHHFDRVVCVDDGSSDGSAEVASISGVPVLRHAVNLGQGAALQTGFEYVLRKTDAQHVVTFDGDGQHDPEDAHRMVCVARREGLDVVLGSRTIGTTTGQSRSRRVLLRAGVAFARVNTGLPLTDTHNGLRVLSRKAIELIHLRQHGMAHASELEAWVARLGLSWREIPVNVTYTPYSRLKGQRSLDALNVMCDLAVARLRGSEW